MVRLLIVHSKTPFEKQDKVSVAGGYLVLRYGCYQMSMRSEAPKEQQDFYWSRQWKECRTEYKKKVGGLCERCLAKGRIEAGCIVHHKQYVDVSNIQDPSVTLNFDNLELLCQNCHNLEHSARKRRYLVMPDGKIFS